MELANATSGHLATLPISEEYIVRSSSDLEIACLRTIWEVEWSGAFGEVPQVIVILTLSNSFSSNQETM